MKKEHPGYLLTSYLFGELPEEQRNKVEAHLQTCPQCRKELAALKSTVELLREAVAGDPKQFALQEERRREILKPKGPRFPLRAFVGRLLTGRRRQLLARAAGIVFVACLGIVGLRVLFPVKMSARRLARSTWVGKDSPSALPAPSSSGEAGSRETLPQRGDSFGSLVRPHAEGESAGERLAERFELAAEAPSLETKLEEAFPKGAKPQRATVRTTRRRNESLPEAAAVKKSRRLTGDVSVLGGAMTPEAAKKVPPQIKAAPGAAGAKPGTIRRLFGFDEAPAREDIAEKQARVAGLRTHTATELTPPVHKAVEETSAVGEEDKAHGAAPAKANKRAAFLRERGRVQLETAPGRKDVQILNGIEVRTRAPKPQSVMPVPQRDARLKEVEKEVEKYVSSITGKEILRQQGRSSRFSTYSGSKQESALAYEIRQFVQAGREADKVAPQAGYTMHPGLLEEFLRSFSYWKRIDPTLSLAAYRARRMPIPPPPLDTQGLRREEFRKRYGVNPFCDTRKDHLSTFGMDVDTASFTYVRSCLEAGKLPDPSRVRVEECINFFPEERPADQKADFTVFSEGGPSPFGRGLELLKISVKARTLRRGERKSAMLTFAVDTSGSMARPASPKRPEVSRLDLVKGALQTLLVSLRPSDRVAVVTFGTAATLLLPPTPARERGRIQDAIESLVPGGPTNVEAGLALAYRVADEAFDDRSLNRVILCSDGVANVGAAGPEEILKKVKVFAGRGVYLSCVGFGLGKYNDAMLETLANRGNGNYAYVDSLKEAARIFHQNLPQTLQVLAKDAKVQVDFNPQVVSHYRLLGYENRDIADEKFRDDTVDAGEVGPGTTVTVLYEIRRRRAVQGPLGRIYLRYREAETAEVREVNYLLSPGVLATSLEETNDRFRFIACVAEFAELLRGSLFARDGSFEAVLKVLESLSPECKRRAAWRTLRDLVLKAQVLTVETLCKQLARLP